MSKPASARKRAAERKNLEKAWEASRRHWEKTPARMANARRTIKLAQAAIRGRPRRLSPAQLAAVRRNVARARAVMARHGRTPEHLAKLRETIKLARAARTPASYRLHNQKILQHGLYARSLRESMRPLGDDPQELASRARLLRAFFGPQDEHEEKIVHALAEAIQRRLRLWRAEALWESRHLEQCLDSASALAVPDPDLTLQRAYLLMSAVVNQEGLFTLDRRLVTAIERLLRLLVRKRSQGRLDLRIFSHLRRRLDAEWADLERAEKDFEMWERLHEGGPEVDAVLKRWRKEWLPKPGAEEE